MTQICGLVGCPISHSLSPALHNRWFQKLGMDARYELFEQHSSEDATRFITHFLSQSQSLGLNITIPFKQLVMTLGIECDASAVRVGAANTLYRVSGGQEKIRGDLLTRM